MFIIAVNPIINAYTQSDLFGKGIFIGLFALSIITWVIFLYKLWIIKNVKKHAKQVKGTFQKKNLNPLSVDLPSSSFTKNVPQPFLEIYRALKSNTLELLNKNRFFTQKKEGEAYLSRSDIDLIEAHIFTLINCQIKSLEKNLFVLSTIVTLAPFLGLLGTVWGILDTFAILQAKTGGNSNDMIMGGLSMALGTTVLGLLVAIPALIAYSYIKNVIQDFSVEMEDFSNLLLASVELQYRKVDITG